MPFDRLSARAFGLSRLAKRRVAMVVDAALSVVAVYVAMYLRIGVLPMPGPTMGALVAASIVLALPIYAMFGVYRQIFGHAGFRSVIEIGRATAVYGLVYAAIFTFLGFAGIPRTVGILQPILLFLLVAASRVFASRWREVSAPASHLAEAPRTLIYGAGNAGRQMAAALRMSREMVLVGFLDDDPALHGSVINGTPIYDPSDVAGVVKRVEATDVLLALPSASQRRRNEIIEAMRAATLHVRTLPGLMDIARGRIALSDIRELDVHDLLGREPVAPDLQLLGRNISGKTVLVTGAGGSIGSELCRQALAVGPARLLLLDVSEFALYAIHRELTEKSPEAATGAVTIVPLLGSVTDAARMRSIIETWQPDTIYHAAAYKHVPLVEHNPAEGIRNNVVGSYTVARVAGELGVPDVVLISTDKAVRPTNVMGTTKRAAELALQALNERFAETRFAMVRFGNVLGSSGSVVPLFRQQIRNGGPVTITDLRIIRYFMTIPEAAQLVIQAGAMATGGEVFVLDMGEPVRIADLARRMIELSGRKVRDEANPTGDIELLEVGLRPGEKLYEELLIGDNPESTSHPRILKANEDFLPLAAFERALTRLDEQMARGDVAGMMAVLGELVPEFQSSTGIVDWVHLTHAERQAVAAGASNSLAAE